MKTLLIVDDEADVREFAANFFRKRKFKVITANSGKEALQEISQNRPDLVLLDIKMGDIDGIEALRRIRQLDNKIKVIMVTGKKPEEEDASEHCRKLGALEYIHKPLQLDELERIVLNQLIE